jgi:hypothetical protein
MRPDYFNRLPRLALLLGTCSLTTAGFGQAQEEPRNTGCPVLVSAKYVPDAAIRPVRPEPGSVVRQPLHITFGEVAHGQDLKILHAQITVRGITEKGGVIPVGSVQSPQSPWVEKAFTVDVARNPAGILASTIWLTGFGGVSDVRVDSITYANGTVWNASENKICRASTGTVLRSSK